MQQPAAAWRDDCRTDTMKSILHLIRPFGIWMPVLFALTARAGETAEPLPRPFLLVEAWQDRPYCSDLYAFQFDGRLLKRLTAEPLPTCSLESVGRDVVTFVGNASAFYSLSLKHGVIGALHAGNVETSVISVDGKGVAFVAGGFPDRGRGILCVRPLVAGSPFIPVEFPLPDTGSEPHSDRFAEMVFAPDGESLVLSSWTAAQAAIVRCDLKAQRLETLLSDPAVSYYSPALSRDGNTLVCIREDRRSDEWDLIASTKKGKVIRTLFRAPTGVALYHPVFADDGRTLVFEMEGVLVRMPASGGVAEGLSGELELIPRPRGLRCASWPGRAASMPSVAGRWIAWVDRTDTTAVLYVIDVRTKEKRIVPLPKGNLLKAVVVE